MGFAGFAARGALVLLTVAALTGCQSLPMPSGSPTPSGGTAGEDPSGGVDTTTALTSPNSVRARTW